MAPPFVGAGTRNQAAPTPGRSTPWPLIGAALLVVALLSGGLVWFLARDSDDEQVIRVELERHDEETDHAFTPSVTLAATDVVGEFISRALADADRAGDSDEVLAVGRVTGDAAGLYGSAADAVCDREALAEHLAGDADLAAGWAEAARVPVEEVEAAVTGWTPVVLGRDSLVTNHAWQEGRVRSYQSVLQAGTAVLVDDHGLPRLRCACGNPLLAPTAAASGEQVDLVGEAWQGFDPGRVAEVVPTDAPVASLSTVDIVSGEPSTVVLDGSSGSVELEGLLVTDDEGVHVHAETGERLATVLDHPVSAVFDDGAGGLLYNHEWSDGRSSLHDPPASADEGTLWHLEAGAGEPTRLVAGDGTNRWAVVMAAGTFGGRRVAFLADLRSTPDGSEGSLVMLDLDSGERQTVVDEAYLHEAPTAGAAGTVYEDGYFSGLYELSMTDELLMYFWSSVDHGGYGLLDSSLADVPTPCDFDFGTPCPLGAVLHRGNEIVAATVDDATETWEWLLGGLARADVRTGADLSAILFGHDSLESLPGETAEVAVDAFDGRAVVSVYRIDGGQPQPAVIVDLDGGSTSHTDAPIDGRVRFLRSPLVRPGANVTAAAPTPDGGPAEPEEQEPEPEQQSPTEPLDVHNILLPGEVCGSKGTEPPVQLVDGEGSTHESDAEAMELGEVYHYIVLEGAVDLDVDGDGRDETAVIAMCHGGFGFSTQVVVLRGTGDGGAEVVSRLPDQFGRLGRAVHELDLDGRTLVLSGVEWLGGRTGLLSYWHLHLSLGAAGRHLGGDRLTSELERRRPAPSLRFREPPVPSGPCASWS